MSERFFLFVAVVAFFICWVAGLAHGIGAIFSRRLRAKIAARPGSVAGWVLLTVFLVGQYMTIFSDHGGLRSSHRIANPFVIALEKRVPVNSPDTPRTYADVLKRMKADRLTANEQDELREALELLVKKARNAGDTGLISCLLTSNIGQVRSRAESVLREMPPTAKTLPLLADELNSPDKELQYEGMMSLWNAALKLGYHHQTLPPACSMHLFATNHDYYLTLWRTWWEANKETMLSRAQAGDSARTLPL